MSYMMKLEIKRGIEQKICKRFSACPPSDTQTRELGYFGDADFDPETDFECWMYNAITG